MTDLEIAGELYQKGLDSLQKVKDPFAVRGQLIEALLRPTRQLVIARVSAMRFWVLLITVGRSWHALDIKKYDGPQDANKQPGFTTWTAHPIHEKPVSYSKAREIASAYALEAELVVLHDSYILEQTIIDETWKKRT